MSALYIWNYQHTKQTLRQDQERQIRELINRLKISLPNALWEYNQGQLEKSVDAEMAAPYVIAIQVDDLRGTLYAVEHAGPNSNELQPFSQQPYHDALREIELRHQVFAKDRPIGTVKIYLTDAFVKDAIREQAITLAIQFLVLAVSIIVVLFVVLLLIVLKPLRTVQEALEQVTSESSDLSTRLSVSPTIEFRGITVGFNQFVEKVQRVLGGSIEDVHASIRDVADGDFYTPITVADGDSTSIMSRLATMQESLRNFSENERDANLLMAAKEAADNANRIKSEFVSNMNHEIRNPLAAIIGVTDLLTRTQLDDRQRKWVDGLRRSGEHLLGIVNQILDFSKLEENSVALENIPFQIDEVVKDALAVMREGLDAKGLKVTSEIEPQVHRNLIGDPFRIGQILLNYLDNALKFTDEGQIAIRISMPQQTDATGVLLIEVEDTGNGVEPERLDHLFQRFSQADTSTTRRYGGTGLGLAICRRIAELMQGAVGATSELGTGSCFWCRIAVGIDREAGSRSAQSAGVARGGYPAGNVPTSPPPPLLANKRVLIAEDVEVNQMVFRAMLLEAGIEVHLADNGVIAAELVEQFARQDRPFDLILMDLHMPVMDGIASTDHILANGRNAELPIIAITADASADVRDNAIRHGIRDFLPKPFERSTLWSVLERNLTPPTRH